MYLQYNLGTKIVSGQETDHCYCLKWPVNIRSWWSQWTEIYWQTEGSACDMCRFEPSLSVKQKHTKNISSSPLSYSMLTNLQQYFLLHLKTWTGLSTSEINYSIAFSPHSVQWMKVPFTSVRSQTVLSVMILRQINMKYFVSQYHALMQRGRKKKVNFLLTVRASMSVSSHIVCPGRFNGQCDLRMT